MSEIKRYKIAHGLNDGDVIHDNPVVVLAADHDAEVAKLTEELSTHLSVHLGVVSENVRLRGELAEAHKIESALIREKSVALSNVEAERDALRLDAERLRAELERHGRHLEGCEGEYGALGLDPCTCGLDAALSAAHGTEGKTPRVR